MRLDQLRKLPEEGMPVGLPEAKHVLKTPQETLLPWRVSASLRLLNLDTQRLEQVMANLDTCLTSE